MTITSEIAAAIARNPTINRVEVSALEYTILQLEFADMQRLSNPRPTYNGPFGSVDRLLWDNLQEEMNLSQMKIMGRPVTIRQ